MRIMLSLVAVDTENLVRTFRKRYDIATIEQSVTPFDPHTFLWRCEGSGLVDVMLFELFGNVAKKLTVTQISRLQNLCWS
jgi:hypothetical protein